MLLCVLQYTPSPNLDESECADAVNWGVFLTVDVESGEVYCKFLSGFPVPSCALLAVLSLPCRACRAGLPRREYPSGFSFAWPGKNCGLFFSVPGVLPNLNGILLREISFLDYGLFC